MSSPGPTHHYRLYGINLAVTCEPAVAVALHARLSHFATAPFDSPELTFEFYTVPSGANHAIERPRGKTRPVYDPPLGEVIYAEEQDQLFIDYGDRVRVLCDLSKGQARVSTRSAESSNLWLVTHPLFSLALTEFLKRRGLYALHAAALSLDGSCMPLAGTSGAGKSTLALALLKAGLSFLGDDLVFLKQTPRGLQALAFPEEIDVTDETVRLFPDLERVVPQPPDGRRKRQVSAESVYGGRVVMECHPAVLVFPRVVQSEESVLKPISAEEAFMELVPNVLLTEAASSQAHLDVLADLAKQCVGYALETGRDLDALSGRLRQLLAGRSA